MLNAKLKTVLLKVLNAKLKPILLVEDDIVDAMTVTRALKELNVQNELVHTTDGKKALEYLRTPGNAQPCVIFLDLNMPEMNGIEFLQIIKAKGILKEIPVVILAASSEEKNIVETFADFDRQEKKRILLEVIQKIKVNSLDEVHLFLSLPRKISLLPTGAESLGSTVQFSAEGGS